MEMITYTADETMALGNKLGGQLVPGDVILLKGDLGAGKTHFVKGIGNALGIKEDITSPTFTILNQFKMNKFKDITFNHFDIYRVHEDEELINIGFEEEVFSNNISVIEWADLLETLIPDSYIEVTIKSISPTERNINIDCSHRKPVEENL